MALVDRFGREITYLRISVTDRCNLHCTYCMPDHAGHARHEAILTFEEIDRVVAVALRLGWRKVRLTGGEPLVRRDTVRLVEMLGRRKGTGPGDLRELTMTSNGILLAQHAVALRAAGLDRVNVSLDTLMRERFQEITGADGLDDVLRGIEAAVDAGLQPAKVNTVLIRGVNDDEVDAFVSLARERRLDMRFIEFMPFAGNGWTRDKVVSSAETQARIRRTYNLVPVSSSPDGGPARSFTARGWHGRVSFISPISDRGFCSGCNRLRMTSEGMLRGCLLDDGEIDLRKELRSGISDDKLALLLRDSVRAKPEQNPYSERIQAGKPIGPTGERGMYRIGG